MGDVTRYGFVGPAPGFPFGILSWLLSSSEVTLAYGEGLCVVVAQIGL